MLLAHGDSNVVCAAMYALGCVEPTVLAEHAPTIAMHLEKDDSRPRAAAVYTLGKLAPLALSIYDEPVAKRLCDECEAVRQAAANTLAGLDCDVLAKHNSVIAALLDDAHGGVRQAAIYALGKLATDVLASHAEAIAERLADEEGGVREAAVEVLGALDPEALAVHKDAISRLLPDESVFVRRAAATVTGHTRHTEEEADASALLYHATDETNAQLILTSQRMKRGKSGVVGGGIYFTSTASDARRKARTDGSVVLQARVELGRTKTLEAMDPSITLESLKASGYDSVRLTALHGDEFVVYDSLQVTRIARV